jgi:hypothetical protein
MLLAFLLGLMGSLGHCLGMCGGVTLLLSRRGIASGWRLGLVHLGRITTYAVLGLVAGGLGQTVRLAFPGLRQLQGALLWGLPGWLCTWRWPCWVGSRPLSASWPG